MYIAAKNESAQPLGVTCKHGDLECAGNAQQLCAAYYGRHGHSSGTTGGDPWTRGWDFIMCVCGVGASGNRVPEVRWAALRVGAWSRGLLAPYTCGLRMWSNPGDAWDWSERSLSTNAWLRHLDSRPAGARVLINCNCVCTVRHEKLISRECVCVSVPAHNAQVSEQVAG